MAIDIFLTCCLSPRSLGGLFFLLAPVPRLHYRTAGCAQAEKPAERVIFGRPSNNIKCGIVGMPNVGKSTTFNIMCSMSVPAENFPVSV